MKRLIRCKREEKLKTLSVLFQKIPFWSDSYQDFTFHKSEDISLCLSVAAAEVDQLMYLLH